MKTLSTTKKTLTRLIKTKIINFNKQLSEIRPNKHKNYLQSKNLERNKNQSNKEEHQEVHQWPKGTVAIIGDSWYRV